MRQFDRVVGRQIFGRDVAGYESARLGYPAELYDHIFERAGPPSQLKIFEVGAGTGLATRDVIARGPAEIVAIEPDLNLARHLEENFAPQLAVIPVPFEENELSAGTFDLGLAAACFHWLDSEKSVRETRRLLRAGGCWAMWWNIYRAAGIGDSFADEVVALLDAVQLPPSETPTGHVGLNSDYQLKLLRDGGLIDVEHHLFRRERTLDALAMRNLYASYSFVRRLEDGQRERLLDRIAKLVEVRFGGTAPNLVLTPLYVAASP